MYAVWAAWVVSWFAAAAWTSETVGRPQGSQILYRAVSIGGGIILFGVNPHWPGNVLWTTGPDVAWATVGAAALGFLFCWWARLHLGRLWSSSVTKKADHRVVDTGPYALVRHPIYTGIIAATIAVFAMKGTLTALAGAAIMSLGWYIKARIEERFLRAELGADAYDAYRKRVPMLVPFT